MKAPAAESSGLFLLWVQLAKRHRVGSQRRWQSWPTQEQTMPTRMWSGCVAFTAALAALSGSASSPAAETPSDPREALAFSTEACQHQTRTVGGPGHALHRRAELLLRHVSVGNDGSRLVLKRMLNGVFSEIARLTPGDTLSVRPGQRYGYAGILGNQHQVFMTVSSDSGARTMPQSGKGMRMSKASADIDNVVVSTGPLFYTSPVGAQLSADGGDQPAIPACDSNIVGQRAATEWRPGSERGAVGDVTIDEFSSQPRLDRTFSR